MSYASCTHRRKAFAIRLSLALLVAALLGASAQGAASIGFVGKGEGKEVIILMKDVLFVVPGEEDKLEAVVVIEPGTTVTWINEDYLTHTVTYGDPSTPIRQRLFDSSGQAQGNYREMVPGESWSFTFTREGEYPFYCIPHPWMVGKVIVKSGS